MFAVLATVHITSTVSLGAVIISALVIAAAGLPVRLLRTLREERQELERVCDQKDEKIAAQAEELAVLRAATDLTSLAEQNRELHVATIDAIRDIAAASMRESEEKLGRLESAVAGGMAAHTKELHKVATILDSVSKKLDVHPERR